MAAIRFAPRSSDVRADESPAEFGGAPRAIAPAGDTITKTTSIRFRFRYNACMGNEERAAEILRQAETSLRELVSAAVADGDYASVLRVAAWAKALSDLIKDIPATRQATRQPVVPPQTSTPGNQKQATPKPTYPRFLRQGDHLVRIAWSKKEKAEVKSMAERTFRKDRRVTIRLYDHDLKGIQKRAMEKGMPYQTLISGMIHQYVEGDLVEKNE